MITKENKVKFFLKVRKISTETFIYLSPWLSLFVVVFLFNFYSSFLGRKVFFSASLCIFLPPNCLVSFLNFPKRQKQ